jgi:calcium-dependent protein kinase
MGSICIKDNTKVVEGKTALKLPFSFDFNIHHRYHFQRVINHGAFGQVKLYSDRIFSGTEYAIKCISKMRVKPNKIHQIKNEIEILSQLDHPNIVTYFCTVEDNKNYYLLMEYLSGKDLDKIFREDYNKITFDDIRFILYQVFSALNYIHSKNIVHRDIKPANIICAKNNGKFDLKLIDFGLSVNLEKRGKYSVAGSLAYLSPEGLKEIIHVKNDLWACGVIFYWFIYGKMPFEKKTRSELYEAIIKEEIEYDENMMRAHTPKEAIDLCQKLLLRDFDERISAIDALKHPFFKKLNVAENDNQIFNDYFTKERVEYIRLYNLGNILKKTFVYVYSMFGSYDEEEGFRKMFLTLDKTMNGGGTLNPRELFEEFKKRDLVNNDDIKAFSFIDPIKTRRVKKILSMNTINTTKDGKSISKKELISQDWGYISYTMFISFCYIDEFMNNKKDCYKPRLKYIFQLMSNGEEIKKKIEEEVAKFEEEEKKRTKSPEEVKEKVKQKENELVSANEWHINKRTFKRFIYKYSLPFQYEKDEIDKFFNDHPDNIHLNDFEELVK